MLNTRRRHGSVHCFSSRSITFNINRIIHINVYFDVDTSSIPTTTIPTLTYSTFLEAVKGAAGGEPPAKQANDDEPPLHGPPQRQPAMPSNVQSMPPGMHQHGKPDYF